jgi:DNA-binding CsgD family transcriptional regulator
MSSLADAREAFARHAWADAFRTFQATDADAPLAPDDLDRLSTAAALTGDHAAAVAARTRAHAGYVDRGDLVRAANCAFWLGFLISNRPDQQAQSGGWFARARRLLEDVGTPCVEQGWLIGAAAHQRSLQNDLPAAYAGFDEARDVGRRFHDRDLVALATYGQGRVLLQMNRPAEGIGLLDEAMVAVTAGDVGPLIAGVVYCGVISACHELFDLRRAHEWTAAMQRWCDAQPDLVAFRVQCVIRRSEVLQWHGAWQHALDEAARACARLTFPPDAPAAYYQLAELHRLRGEFAQADDAYRRAAQAGRPPSPGLPLLRLSQGQTDASATAIRLALHEVKSVRARVLLLAAAVEILLAAHDPSSAERAADELADIARSSDSPFLHALSSRATGAVALDRGDAATALQSLRDAATAWQALDAPYEFAKTRVLIGLAYRQLRDDDGAQLELDAAAEIFDRLGAAPDAARVAALTTEGERSEGSLTGREVEVLRLIATGATNRAIAARLQISEKTVARHVSNIFTKLDLPSRAAATAYAYEHKLVS